MFHTSSTTGLRRALGTDVPTGDTREPELQGTAGPADLAPHVAQGAEAPSPLACQDWCRSVQTACDAIPQGQLYRWLSAQWLEQQIQLGPRGATAHALPTLRVELRRICAQAALGLRLHAGLGGSGHAAAISAELMLGLNRLLNEDLGGPLNKVLVNRIYAEFNCPAPDWPKLVLPPGTSEPLLAMALMRSGQKRPKPPVRFAVDLVSERKLPHPAPSRAPGEPRSDR